jgi:hypothetical protein
VHTLGESATCDMTSLQCFMKIGGGVQLILRFCLRNFSGCNVCIIDGWNL